MPVKFQSVCETSWPIEYVLICLPDQLPWGTFTCIDLCDPPGYVGMDMPEDSARVQARTEPMHLCTLGEAVEGYWLYPTPRETFPGQANGVRVTEPTVRQWASNTSYSETVG